MTDIPNNTSTTSVLTGSGTYTSALEVNADSDWWAVDLVAGKTYDFKISGDGSVNSLDDGRIVIRDAFGNEIDSTGSQNTPLSITATTTGRYYIEVADSYTYDNAAEGNYVLTANMSDDIVNNVTTTRVIGSTGTIASSLAQSNDSDWFKVSLKAGMTYGFIVTGDGSTFSLGDGRVVIRDSLGNEIDSSSDGNLLSFRATTDGVYYVEVKDDYTYDNTAEGNYRLTSTLSDTLRSDVGTSGVILDGADLTGRMDVAGDSDWYKLATVSGRTYTLTVKGDGTATSFDNQQIELRDAAGNRLDYDTGTSSSGGATLTFKATTSGPVYVVVATQQYSSDDGGFVLQVRSDSIVLNGSAGNDTLTGQGQNNQIYGNAGHDRLDGGAGNDLLNGGAGDDVLLGGDGLDTLYGAIGNDYMVGGAGVDTALFLGAVATRVDLRLTGRQATGHGSDLLSGIENVTTDSGADSLIGNALGNGFVTGAGNDTIRAIEGNDRVDAGLGDDVADGGVGIDTFVFTGTTAARLNLGYAGPQTTGYGVDVVVGFENVAGGSGADLFTGSALGNVMEGNAGADTLNGLDGNDTLVGGADSDRLDGGNGNDVLNGGLGNDVLVGGAGVDTAYYLGSAAIRVNLGTTAAQVTGQGTDALSGIENVLTGSGSDVVTGNSLANSINTGAGNDVIVAGAGADILFAGIGNDRITAGSGNDVMTGGAGSDSFVFNLHDGSDRIADFEDGTDRIVIDSGATSYSQLTITQSGANSIVKFGDVTLTLTNVSYWQLDSSDFLFV